MGVYGSRDIFRYVNPQDKLHNHDINMDVWVGVEHPLLSYILYNLLSYGYLQDQTVVSALF